MNRRIKSIEIEKCFHTYFLFFLFLIQAMHTTRLMEITAKIITPTTICTVVSAKIESAGAATSGVAATGVTREATKQLIGN